MPSPNIGTGQNVLNAVAVVSANDVWAVGNTTDPNRTLIEHWDGVSWSIVPSPNAGTGGNYLYGVAVVSANDVWAVGRYATPASQTLMEHWDGVSWSVVPSPNLVGNLEGYLQGVAGASTNDVWAVGYSFNDSTFAYQTLIEHWDGVSWSVVPSPNPGTTHDDLYGIAILSANDMWAVGRHLDNLSSSYQTLTEHYYRRCPPTSANLRPLLRSLLCSLLRLVSPPARHLPFHPPQPISTHLSI